MTEHNGKLAASNSAHRTNLVDTHPGGIAWRDNNVPVSCQFDDAYYAYQDGRQESETVFISGNALVERWRSDETPVVAELGFGTGLNFLATWAAWREMARHGIRQRATHRARPDDDALRPIRPVRFVSFELAPISAEAMVRSLSAWPDLLALADPLIAAWPPQTDLELQTPQIHLSVLIGDARTSITDWPGPADAWYLDGFSPSKNPQLWEPALLDDVFARTRPGGTFSTYTAAGWVRRNLAASGFTVQRVPGFANKRERLQGFRPWATG